MILAKEVTEPCGSTCPASNVLNLLQDHATIVSATVDRFATQYIVNGLTPNKRYCFYVIPIVSGASGFEVNATGCGGTVGCTLSDGTLCSVGTKQMIISTDADGNCLGTVGSLFQGVKCCSDIQNGVAQNSVWNSWEPGCASVNSFTVMFNADKFRGANVLGPVCGFDLNSISLYDIGSEGLFRVEAINLDGSISLIADYVTTRYLQWHHISPNLRGIAGVRFTKVDPTANIGKISLCATRSVCVEPLRPAYPLSYFDQTETEEIGKIAKEITASGSLEVKWDKIFVPGFDDDIISVEEYAVLFGKESDNNGSPIDPKVKFVTAITGANGISTEIDFPDINSNSPIRVAGIIPNMNCSPISSNPQNRSNCNSEVFGYAVYPNPTNNAWLLKSIDNTIVYDALLYSLDGKLLFSRNNLLESLVIPAEKLLSGQYLLVIKDKNSAQTLRLIKI
jgi:hypothetical protein